MISAPDASRSRGEAGVRRSSGVAVFSGGGTGGHLYPALALAEALQEQRPDMGMFFVGARRGIEARVLPAREVDHLLVPVYGFRRGELLANLAVIRNLFRSVVQVAAAFRARRPSLVVVTGGYAGGPAGLVAVLMRLPLVLQEQNSVPGITTRVLSLFAREVHVAFPEAVTRLPRIARRKARVSGNPVRFPRPVDRTAAAARFELDPRRPVVLVVGGSQGARAINEAVVEAVALVMNGGAGSRREAGDVGPRPRPDLQLLWSTGPAHLEDIRDRLRELGDPSWIRLLGFIEEMPLALGLAQVAVSRAGAMATSEFLAWGLPAILVPLPGSAADHQRMNARALARAGAADLLEEPQLTGRVLWARIARLVEDERARTAMEAAARERGHPDAAQEIARSLARLLPGGLREEGRA